MLHHFIPNVGLAVSSVACPLPNLIQTKGIWDSRERRR